MICDHEDCIKDATHIPQLNVPAVGVPIEAHQPLSACLNVKMCHQHTLEFDTKGQFAPGAPEALREIFLIMASGRAEPDFERAFTTAVPLDSPLAIALERAGKREN